MHVLEPVSVADFLIEGEQVHVHVAVIPSPVHNGRVCACVGQQCTFTLFSPFIVILGWFVEKPVIQAALKGVLIEEENVECRPEKVSNAVLDENVDIHLTRSYFSQDAWMIIEGVLWQKESAQVGHVLYVNMTYTVSHPSSVNPVWNGTTFDVLA